MINPKWSSNALPVITNLMLFFISESKKLCLHIPLALGLLESNQFQTISMSVPKDKLSVDCLALFSDTFY